MSNLTGIYQKNDKNYLGNDKQYTEPKESFKAVAAAIERVFGNDPISLCDAGCATGAFPFFAVKRFKLKECVGYDISEKLIEQAKREVPEAEFIVDSITEPANFKGRQFDVVTCLGTLAIFDDVGEALRGLCSLVRPGGLLVTYDLINDNPIDVITRFRDMRPGSNNEEWRCAFNVRSKVTYENEFKKIDPTGTLKFTDFAMPFAIAKTDDPLRAWTIPTAPNAHQLTVGTGQLLNFKVVQFQKGRGR